MTEIKYEFNKESCFYLDVCPLKDTKDCNESCLRYLEMFYLMNKSRLPKSQHKIHRLKPEQCDVQAFKKLSKIKADIVNFVKEGKNLYIYSKNCGNGKTTWSIKFMQSYFNGVWFGNRYRMRAIFVNVPLFMIKLRENISNKSEDFIELLEELMLADLVIWDDIAACTLKEYDYMNLLGYVDNRIIEGKSNIFTGNLGENGIIQALGERLASRIWNNSARVELLGLDRRNGEEND